jgi:hypothetical protein
MVGETGFEPATPWSRRLGYARRTTRYRAHRAPSMRMCWTRARPPPEHGTHRAYGTTPRIRRPSGAAQSRCPALPSAGSSAPRIRFWRTKPSGGVRATSWIRSPGRCKPYSTRSTQSRAGLPDTWGAAMRVRHPTPGSGTALVRASVLSARRARSLAAPAPGTAPATGERRERRRLGRRSIGTSPARATRRPPSRRTRPRRASDSETPLVAWRRPPPRARRARMLRCSASRRGTS